MSLGWIEFGSSCRNIELSKFDFSPLLANDEFRRELANLRNQLHSFSDQLPPSVGEFELPHGCFRNFQQLPSLQDGDSVLHVPMQFVNCHRGFVSYHGKNLF